MILPGEGLCAIPEDVCKPSLTCTSCRLGQRCCAPTAKHSSRGFCIRVKRLKVVPRVECLTLGSARSGSGESRKESFAIEDAAHGLNQVLSGARFSHVPLRPHLDDFLNDLI